MSNRPTAHVIGMGANINDMGTDGYGCLTVLTKHIKHVFRINWGIHINAIHTHIADVGIHVNGMSGHQLQGPCVVQRVARARWAKVSGGTSDCPQERPKPAVAHWNYMKGKAELKHDGQSFFHEGDLLQAKPDQGAGSGIVKVHPSLWSPGPGHHPIQH